MRTFLLPLFMTFALTTFGQNNPETAYIVFIDFENPMDSFMLSLDIDTTNADNI